MLTSLDPRVNRLLKTSQGNNVNLSPEPEQFGTFEVFVQQKDGKPFQHEGAVHASNLEMAYVLAKETFTRRFLCSSLYVVETKNIFVSAFTEGNISIYDTIDASNQNYEATIHYEIYHLLKRGKQHIHAGTVVAANHEAAIASAKKELSVDKVIYNVWVIKRDDIRFTSPDEEDLWLTLPEKKFRDASNYKGGDKLNDFLQRSKPIQGI